MAASSSPRTSLPWHLFTFPPPKDELPCLLSVMKGKRSFPYLVAGEPGIFPTDPTGVHVGGVAVVGGGRLRT